jgi:hypothetical protein
LKIIGKIISGQANFCPASLNFIQQGAQGRGLFLEVIDGGSWCVNRYQVENAHRFTLLRLRQFFLHMGTASFGLLELFNDQMSRLQMG